MKSDITRRESTTAKGMMWYSWTEICDDCGKKIYTSGNWDTSVPPVLDKKDYCLECLRKRIDQQISNK
ncbi:MAG: hypothetical protein Q7R33_04775 [Nitrosarchaeum sp.]|nr:hypothetical protein [Nitrosarchaeum sp.]